MSALLSGLQTGSIYALIGLGYVVVYRASGYLILSMGEVVMLGGLVATSVGLASAGSMAVSVVASMALGATISGAMYALVIRRMRDPSPLRVIILSFGVALVLRAGARQLWGAEQRFTAALDSLPRTISIGWERATIRGQALLIVVVLAVAVLALRWWFSKTATGRAARAAGDDPIVAAATGIPLVVVVTLAFAVAGGLGGLAGALAVPITGVAWNTGTLLGLKGLVGALAGGVEHPMGPIAGGLALGLAEQLASVYVVAGWNDAVAFGVLVVVVLVRSVGPLEART